MTGRERVRGTLESDWKQGPGDSSDSPLRRQEERTYQSAQESNRAFLESHDLPQGYKQRVLRERQGPTWCSSAPEG